jgi:hypothetical protein
MDNISGFGIRSVWSAFDETGKQYFFRHKCDYNEAINGGKYFNGDPTIKTAKKESVVEKKVEVAEASAATPTSAFISTETGIKRRKVKEEGE